MGVNRLNTYMRGGKPNAYCYDVDIVKLAQEYARKERKRPVIVVDGTASLYSLIDYRSNDWLMGGQFRVYKAKLQAFVEAFKAAGIKLVFFFDGSVVEKKRHVWVERQTDRNQRQRNIFEDLRNGKSPSQNVFPPLLGACGRFIYLHELDGECEVHVSVGECDEEMALYARKNKCFAFLASDTDFVIHEGAHYFLLLNNFNIKTMRTVCFDRTALAESLSLSVNHLPLLASLMGNDMVPRDMLGNFHRNMCWGRVDVFKLVPKLAQYVNKFPSGDLGSGNLKKIAADVFGDSNLAAFLENSIRMYNCSSTYRQDINWNVMPEAQKRHRMCQIPRTIYPLMNGQPYELSVGLEVFDGDMEATAKVYRTMRRRLYGVLLHDNPSHPNAVEEWCVEADEISKTALRVKVIVVPDNSHPGLLRLWTEETSRIEQRRWELFTWCISPSLDVSALRDVHPRYHVLVAALYYLVHYDTRLLDNWEVEAIMAQAVLLQTMDDGQLKKLAAPLPEPRAVQVASLLGRGITTVLLVMAGCGIPLKQMMPWQYYDGRLFLQQYMLTKVGRGFSLQNSADVQAKKDFTSIRKFVYEN